VLGETQHNIDGDTLGTQADNSGLQHFVLTRFSYRDPYPKAGKIRSSGGDWIRGIDPLQPHRLDFRFTLFEMVCLPNVLAQTNSNFDWILIIDKNLPAAYRERLRTKVAGRARTYLHEFDPQEDIRRLDWLRPYCFDNTTQILTTLLDDDDAIPLTFVEAIQRHIRDLGESGISLKTFGCRRSLQWELVTSRKRPFGYLARWHRTNYVMSVGFSLLCKYPFRNVSVFAMRHVLADIWYEKVRGEELRRLLVTRWKLPKGKGQYFSRFCRKELDDFQTLVGAWFGWEEPKHRRVERLFHDLSNDIEGPIIQTNHFLNDQGTRLFEPKVRVRDVAGPETFPNCVIDWSAFPENSHRFEKSPKVFVQLLREAIDTSRHLVKFRRIGTIASMLYLAYRFLRF
jgi:hypothetical protein